MFFPYLDDCSSLDEVALDPTAQEVCRRVLNKTLWAGMRLMEPLPGSLSVFAGWERRIVDVLVTSSWLQVSILVMIEEWSMIFIRDHRLVASFDESDFIPLRVRAHFYQWRCFLIQLLGDKSVQVSGRQLLGEQHTFVANTVSSLITFLQKILCTLLVP